MMLKIVLAVSILNASSVAVLWALLLKRRLRRSELQILMDSIDMTREHVEAQGINIALEHKSFAKSLLTANGRLQFLMAKTIAEQLAEVKAEDEARKKAEQEKADGLV